MYEKIKDRRPVYEVYQEKLLEDGVDAGQIREMVASL